ncbi:response regulator transcription factor [Paenibacillus sp. CN-4]|uniref:response regulator transcription factor n=1 Tax=Paenibacillus nanchangensis TaxID=3348343 RepID=UPI00397B4ECA
MDKTLLIVEDDRSLNKGIALALAQSGLRIEQAYTLADARSIAARRRIDLIILDINLPDGSGLDYCEQLRRANNRVPVVFLTANDMETDIVAGLELGGDDYITKPFSLMVLRARVLAVLRRSEGRSGDLLEYGLFRFDFAKMEFAKAGEPLNLSKTEQKLLRMLTSHTGSILTREQLMEGIWSVDADFVDENALSVAVKRLRSKLEEDPSQPVYIKTVYGLGYMWPEGKL